MTEDLTLSQLKRKVFDDAEINQCQQDKNKKLSEHLRGTHCDIILVLDEYAKLNAEMQTRIEDEVTEKMETIENLKAEHTEEMRKNVLMINEFFEKNQVNCQTVNDVSFFK